MHVADPASQECTSIGLCEQEAGHREKAALFETRVALREAFFGNAPAAKRSAMEALALAKDREVQFGAAVLWPSWGFFPGTDTCQ